jgi:hypothetical protein
MEALPRYCFSLVEVGVLPIGARHTASLSLHVPDRLSQPGTKRKIWVTIWEKSGCNFGSESSCGRSV